MTSRPRLLAALTNPRTKAQPHSTPPPLAFELQDSIPSPQSDWNFSPFSVFQNSIFANFSTDPSNISSFPEPPPHAPVRFDSLTGMLVIQGDNRENILHETISKQGYYELNLDGLLFSSDINSAYFAQALAGATRDSVKALSFEGGLGHDTLILDRQNLSQAPNQTFSITADDEVDIQGNITSKGDIYITADEIKLNAKLQANSVVFNATSVFNQGEIKTKDSTQINFTDKYRDSERSAISGKQINITGGLTGNLETSGKFVAKEISLLGKQVSLLGANLNASGKNGGGTVLIGGDYQGKGVERGIVNAKNTVVDINTVIRADALVNGNGGKVIIWSDQAATFDGSVSVKGASKSGDGGFVEVSGKQYLTLKGKVDTSAAHGKHGKLLIDPTNIEVSNYSNGSPYITSISPSWLIAQVGDITLSATNNIDTRSTPFLDFTPSTGTITFQADSDNNGAGYAYIGGINTNGRDVNVSGALVNIYFMQTMGGSLNVSGSSLGEVAITSLSTSGAGNSGSVNIS